MNYSLLLNAFLIGKDNAWHVYDLHSRSCCMDCSSRPCHGQLLRINHWKWMLLQLKKSDGPRQRVDVDHTSIANAGDANDAEGHALRPPRLVGIEKGCCIEGRDAIAFSPKAIIFQGAVISNTRQQFHSSPGDY